MESLVHVPLCPEALEFHLDLGNLIDKLLPDGPHPVCKVGVFDLLDDLVYQFDLLPLSLASLVVGLLLHNSVTVVLGEGKAYILVVDPRLGQSHTHQMSRIPRLGVSMPVSLPPRLGRVIIDHALRGSLAGLSVALGVHQLAQYLGGRVQDRNGIAFDWSERRHGGDGEAFDGCPGRMGFGRANEAVGDDHGSLEWFLSGGSIAPGCREMHRLFVLSWKNIKIINNGIAVVVVVEERRECLEAKESVRRMMRMRM